MSRAASSKARNAPCCDASASIAQTKTFASMSPGSTDTGENDHRFVSVREFALVHGHQKSIEFSDVSQFPCQELSSRTPRWDNDPPIGHLKVYFPSARPRPSPKLARKLLTGRRFSRPPRQVV